MIRARYAPRRIGLTTSEKAFLNAHPKISVANEDYHDRHVLVRRVDSGRLIAIHDLKDKVLAFPRGFALIDHFRKHHPHIALAEADNVQMVLEMISDGSAVGTVEQERVAGISNRMKLDRVLARELQRSFRYSDPFCFILLDVDKFKSVNDTFGHHAGDGVLKEMAAILSAQVRKTDTVGRWGGEEFVISARAPTLRAGAGSQKSSGPLLHATVFPSRAPSPPASA